MASWPPLSTCQLHVRNLALTVTDKILLSHVAAANPGVAITDCRLVIERLPDGCEFLKHRWSKPGCVLTGTTGMLEASLRL
jgi:hypothetical protein